MKTNVLGVLLGIGLVFGLWQQQQILSQLEKLQAGGAAAPTDPAAAIAAAQPKRTPALSNVSFDFAVAGAPSRGKADAPAVYMEFSDFECPFCGRYVKETLPRLIADYVDTGKMRYIFRQFPLESLHPNALNAAYAGTCAADRDHASRSKMAAKNPSVLWSRGERRRFSPRSASGTATGTRL